MSGMTGAVCDGRRRYGLQSPVFFRKKALGMTVNIVRSLLQIRTFVTK